MSSLWVIAASTVVLAYLVTWAARPFARKIGFLDAPDGAKKTHQHATPLLGGAAVFIAFTVSVLLLLFTSDYFAAAASRNFLFGIMLSGGLYCCLGLYDDRWPLRARHKFLLQIVATIPFVALGTSIAKLHLLGMELNLGFMAIPFTIFWIVSCVNVVNLMDGMDGLAATIGLVASTTLALLSLSLGQTTLAPIGFLFAASLCGFLFHNWPPARIFLGDAGSLLIGFVIAALSTGGALKTATGFVLIFPTVLLAIPIADTALAIVRRKLMGQGIGDGDRGHIHHRLQERGLSKVNSLLVIVGLCVAMAAVVLVAGHIQNDWLALVLGSAILTAGFLGRILGFHELHLASRSIQIVLQVARHSVDGLRARMSSMRLAASGSRHSGSLWELVEAKAKLAGAIEVELTVEDVPSETQNVVRRWVRPEARSVGTATWNIRYCVIRSRDARVLVAAKGYSMAEEGQQAFESLAQLCTEICRGWPVDSPAILSISNHFEDPVSNAEESEAQMEQFEHRAA